jgi:hypothetical protein
VRLARCLERVERGRSERVRGCVSCRPCAILVGDAHGPPWLERGMGRFRLSGRDVRCILIVVEAVPDRRPDTMVPPAP